MTLVPSRAGLRAFAPGLLWVAPALAVLALLSIYPLIFLVQASLTGPHGFTLSHYARMLQDRLFLTAAFQTLVYAVAALTCEFFLGLGLALLVDSVARGRTILRAGLLMPMLLPPVLAAVIWRLIYNPQFGILNATLARVGLNTSHFASYLTWTSGQSTALASVILVDVWEWTPFVFLLLSAGLQTVPVEPVEAARIDGANYWQILRDVILPYLRPVMLLALLLRSMDLLRIFDQVMILTQGGPGSATETVSLYIYRTAFRFFDFGYAAAMSFVGLVVTTLAARGLIRLVRPVQRLT